MFKLKLTFLIQFSSDLLDYSAGRRNNAVLSTCRQVVHGLDLLA